MSHREKGSALRILNVVFDIHVLELAGFEDLAAFFALHEFRFLVAAHDLHSRMFAGLLRIHIRG